MFSPNEDGDPPFFSISDITNSSSFNDKILGKKSMLENFHLNVLKWAFQNNAFCTGDIQFEGYSVPHFKMTFKIFKSNVER